MKKLLIIGMILLLTGCTVVIKPDCKCECPSNIWHQDDGIYVNPFGVPNQLVPNTYDLQTLEGWIK